MRYSLVIEKAAGNYFGDVPDLLGCVATGAIIKDVERKLREATRFHLIGLRKDGLPVSELTSIADRVEVIARAPE